MKKRTYISIIAALCIILLMLLWLLKPVSKEAQLEERVFTVRATALEQGNFSPELMLYGTIDSPQKSTLASRLAAKITEVHIREGDQVQQGALLIALDPREFQLAKKERQAQVSRLEASIAAEQQQHLNNQKTLKHLQELEANNEKMLKPYEALRAKKLGADAQVDDAMNTLLQQQISLRNQELAIANYPNRLKQLQADLASSKAQLATAELNLSYTHINAPFSGKITELLVSLGDDVSVNQKLLSLYHLEDVELKAQLPYRFIRQIQQKQQVKAVAEAFPEYTLHFLRLGAELTAGDASIDAYFRIPLPLAEQLPLGFTLKVRIALPVIDDIYRIPSTALYNNNTIYQVIDHNLISIPVQRLGEQFEGDQHFYLIQGAKLQQGMLVLSSRLPDARDGLKVMLR